MNYAFFANARAFYAAPVLAAATIVLFEYCARAGVRSFLVWGSCGALPVLGVALATAGFHENVPVAELQLMVRDPLLMALLLAAGVWWYGCVRRGPVALLHAGSAALALAAVRGLATPGELPDDFRALVASVTAARDGAALALYAVAAYLLAVAWLRRSRGEIVAALGAHWVAFALLVEGRIVADDMSICLLGGWTWLAGLHVMIARPRWVGTVWPIAFLVIVTAVFGARSELRWYGAGHAAGMVAVLVVVGWLWPWTRYRTLGIVAGVAFLTLGAGRTAVHCAHPKAAAAVLTAFLLLAAGATVSWHKRRLRELIKTRKSTSEHQA
jgi:hypothetical protein